MKKLVIAATLLLVAAIGLAVLVAPASPEGGTFGSTLSGPVDQVTLQQDAAMTQAMSVPKASGPMQSYAIVDPQLRHSSNPAFLRQLEQYQGDIDRMLARPNR